MPLVVQLLFADADAALSQACRAAQGHYAAAMADKMHLLTAQGVFDELNIQLNDPKSMLRTAGSAFGILAGLGTSLRIVEHRTVTSADLPDRMSLGAAKEAPSSMVTYEATDSDPLSRKVEQQRNRPIEMEACGTKRTGPVPRISNFPGAWYHRAFTWWVSCVPESCGSGCSQPRVKIAVFCESQCSPDLHRKCEPAHICAVSPAAVAANYEAGSGGWPLCVPHAYMCFRPVSPQTVAQATSDMAAKLPAWKNNTEPNFSEAFAKAEEQPNLKFHHVSVEADDEDIFLLLLSSKIVDQLTLPTWLNTTRVVVPRGNVSRSRYWSPGEVVGSWPEDLEKRGGPAFHHWVELECRPSVCSFPICIIVALPHADIAQRFHEACSRTPRPPKPLPTQEPDNRAALVCELQLLANVDVLRPSQAHNCGTSMRRSICEATGIQRNRVQVLSVKDGGGTIIGWAAAHLSGIQKALLTPSVKKPDYPDV